MQQTYETLKATVLRDPHILGFFVKGSHGKNRQTEQSDYDIELIVQDEAADEYKKQFESSGVGKNDVVVQSITEFRTYAAWGSAEAWDRYDFARVHVEVDKLNGEIQRLVDEKGSLPAEHANAHVRYHLDSYINGVFRSLKCIRDGNKFGARIESAESMTAFLQLIFGLHGRLKPYAKYLAWELTEFPLKQLSWDADELQKDILSILETADIKTQQKLFAGVIDLAKTKGYGDAIDAWEGIPEWLIKL